MTTTSTTVDVSLNLGEYYFGAGSLRLRTLLGSCVAITLWHPQRRIGGMCHYVLPSRAKGPQTAPDGRYADEVFAALLDRITQADTRPQDYEIKIFGGGNMFPCLGSGNCRTPSQTIFDIGRRNVDMARRFAQQQGLQPRKCDVEGSGHRQVIFDLRTGEDEVKHTPLPSDRQKADVFVQFS